MQKIKIFYFIPNLQQGGPERQVLELIRQLPEQFEPILCLYHDNIFFKRELPPDQPRYVLGGEKINLKLLGKLVDILRKEKPVIMHSYRDKSNFWARIAALRAGVPIIISACRNRMMQMRYLLVEKLLSDRCDMVLTNSRGVKNELISWAKVDPNRIRVIHNILDIDRYRNPTKDERQRARAQWDLPHDHLALLLPGRIGLQKNQIGLLLALDRLARSKDLPKFTLLLTGRNRDLRTAWVVRKLARKRVLRDKIRFLGPQADMPRLYWASDMLVMPSLWEGLSNAALEGCASGLPAILSHAANVDDIVVHQKTGLEVPTTAVGALSDALYDMLNKPIEQLRAMGELGREHVINRFAPTEDFVVKQTIEVYDELLKSHAIR